MTTHLSVRLAVVVEEEAERVEVVDLGRVHHEVRPAELWARVESLEEEDGSPYLVQAWEEDERIRVLRDEREVDRVIAEALTEGRLDQLIADAVEIV